MFTWFKRGKDHPDYNVVYRDFMDEGSATRLNRSLSSDSKWSYNVLSSREKSKDENIGGKGESMAGRRSSDFIGSSTTVSGEPGSLLSLPMGLSLTSLNRRSSFNKSCNTLMNSPRFGSIYEIEEKDDEKQQKEDRPCDEDDNGGRSTEEPSPENEHNVTCYLEDEVANAKSMCNLDMPQDPQARRSSITFCDTVMIMGLAQRRNSSPGGTTDTTSDTETVDVSSRRSSLVSHIEYHQQNVQGTNSLNSIHSTGSLVDTSETAVIDDQVNLLPPPTITFSQYDSMNNLNRSVQHLNMI